MTLAQEFHYSGLSPEEEEEESLHGIESSNSFMFDDDLKEFGDVSESKPKKNNGRKGPHNTDKRAVHNAIERARRETLNGRFMTLAEALPAMAKVKRPSKSAIVNKALDFVYEAQVKEHALVKENNELRRQVDELRRQLGLPNLPQPEPLTTGNNSDRVPTPTANKRVKSSKTSSSMNSSTAKLNTLGNSCSPPSLFGSATSPESSFVPSPDSTTFDTMTSPGLPFTVGSINNSTVFAPSSIESPNSSNFSGNEENAVVRPIAIPSQHQPGGYMPPTMNGLNVQSAPVMMAAQPAGPYGYMNPNLMQQHQIMLQAGHHPHLQQINPYDLYQMNAQLIPGWQFAPPNGNENFSAYA